MVIFSRSRSSDINHHRHLLIVDTMSVVSRRQHFGGQKPLVPAVTDSEEAPGITGNRKSVLQTYHMAFYIYGWLMDHVESQSLPLRTASIIIITLCSSKVITSFLSKEGGGENEQFSPKTKCYQRVCETQLWY